MCMHKCKCGVRQTLLHCRAHRTSGFLADGPINAEFRFGSGVASNGPPIATRSLADDHRRFANVRYGYVTAHECRPDIWSAAVLNRGGGGYRNLVRSRYVIASGDTQVRWYKKRRQFYRITEVTISYNTKETCAITCLHGGCRSRGYSPQEFHQFLPMYPPCAPNSSDPTSNSPTSEPPANIRAVKRESEPIPVPAHRLTNQQLIGSFSNLTARNSIPVLCMYSQGRR